MHINNIFNKSLLSIWRPVVGGPRQSLGKGAIFSRTESSAVVLESKAGQPGHCKRIWSVDELQVLKSEIATGFALKDIVQSCARRLPDRTPAAIKYRRKTTRSICDSF